MTAQPSPAHAKRCCPGRDDAPEGVSGDVPDGVGPELAVRRCSRLTFEYS